MLEKLIAAAIAAILTVASIPSLEGLDFNSSIDTLEMTVEQENSLVENLNILIAATNANNEYTEKVMQEVESVLGPQESWVVE
jgi:hypothetical protein